MSRAHVLRTSCPDCGTGCDACFSGGRAHEIRLRMEASARVATTPYPEQIHAAFRQNAVLLLRITNANALADRLGHRIHRFREDRKQLRLLLDEARRINHDIYAAHQEAHGELTPELIDNLHRLDCLLDPEPQSNPAAQGRRRDRLRARRAAEQVAATHPEASPED